ncbi:hypothetical protein HDU67_002651 [Dinochytrium kinnereticum]|nr:hypothetical protein HDU67_002651 [Dinochytrium kinnereticum]
MTLWLGANDAVDPKANPRQGVTLEDYGKNLTSMIETAKTMIPELRILILTPPPVDANKWGDHCRSLNRLPDRHIDRTTQYRDACLNVAKEASAKWPNDIGHVDSFDALGIQAGMSEEVVTARLRGLLHDGLHFNAEGNSIMGKTILNAILRLWPDMDPEKMRMTTPWHAELDEKEFFQIYNDPMGGGVRQFEQVAK